MVARKSASRLIGILLLAALLLPSTHNTLAQDSGNPNACVRVFQQWDDYNVATYQLDTSTGKLTSLNDPAVPPTATFSPDGKYAIFLKILDNPQQWQERKIGLFVGQVGSGQPPILLTVYKQIQLEHLNGEIGYYFKWAPDSGQLAYVEIENDQFYVTIVRPDGSNKRRVLAPVPANYPGLDDAYISGWSADSQYLAVVSEPRKPDEDYAHTDYLTVLPAASLLPLDVGFLSHFAIGYGRPDIAWEPTGHQLAALLEPPDTTLVLWSPEHEVEAQHSVSLRGNYYELHWAPDIRQLQIVDSDGHGATDILFGVDGANLVEAETDADWRTLIGWTADGSAAVVDRFNATDKMPETRHLLRISPIHETSQPIDEGVFERQAAISPDGRRMVYLVKADDSYLVKLFELTTGGKTVILRDSMPSVDETQFEFSLTMDTRLFWTSDNDHLLQMWWNSKGEPVLRLIPLQQGGIKAELDARTFVWVEDHWIAYVGYGGNTGFTKLLNLSTGDTTLLETYIGEYRGWYSELTLSPDKKLAALVVKDGVILTSLDPAKPWQQKIPSEDTSEYSILKFIGFWNFSTDISFSKYRLAWAPDGSKLAFISAVNIGPRLSVIDRSGARQSNEPLPVPENAAIDSRTFYLVQWGCNTIPQ